MYGCCYCHKVSFFKITYSICQEILKGALHPTNSAERSVYGIGQPLLAPQDFDGDDEPPSMQTDRTHCLLIIYVAE